jgi:hypothetical protein
MTMHVEALFVHNSLSRLVSVNDWNGGEVPRFFLGRTLQGNLWRFRDDLPPEICNELEVLCEAEPCSHSNAPKFEAEYLRILSKDSPVKSKWLGPAYSFPTNVLNKSVAQKIDTSKAGLLRENMPDWIPDIPHQQPFLAQVVLGKVVAICASVRITGLAHEAGVETLKAHRQKGYAVSVVSAWSDAVKESGAQPLYSTSFDNYGSLKVIAKLGLEKYGVDFHAS